MSCPCSSQFGVKRSIFSEPIIFPIASRRLLIEFEMTATKVSHWIMESFSLLTVFFNAWLTNYYLSLEFKFVIFVMCTKRTSLEFNVSVLEQFDFEVNKTDQLRSFVGEHLLTSEIHDLKQIEWRIAENLVLNSHPWYLYEQEMLSRSSRLSTRSSVVCWWDGECDLYGPAVYCRKPVQQLDLIEVAVPWWCSKRSMAFVIFNRSIRDDVYYL